MSAQRRPFPGDGGQGGLGPPLRRPATLARSLSALLALTLTGCGTAVPEEWTLDLEPLLVLGGGDDAAAAEAFYEPMGLRIDGRGRAHVLDSGNGRIQIFAPDGTFERSLGRPGAGPGELAQPEGLWVFGDGEVVVADSGNARLTRFGPGGDPLDPVALEFLPLDVAGGPKRIWVLRLPPPALVAGSDPTPLVHAYDRDGRPVGGRVTPAPSDIGLLYFVLNTLRIAAAPDGGFAVAETHVRSRIRVHDAEGAETGAIPVLYKAQGWAPLGRLPATLDDHGLETIARTATDLAWDARRGLYWVLSGHVDREPDGTWVTARELYRYAADGSYRGSVMLPFRARRVAPSPDGSVWLLDEDGLVRRMRLRDPETVPTGAGNASG